MAKKIRVWDGTQWQDVAPALPYTAVHSAQASMPSTGVDGQIWLDTDGTLSDTAFVPLSTIDAKGDLLVGTADNTVNKLTVGSNNTVLTADSSTATGLKWATPAAGGMTLLSTTTLSGNSTSITGISGDYTNLQIWIQNYYSSISTSMLIQPNGSANITNYLYQVYDTVSGASGNNGTTSYDIITPDTSTSSAVQTNMVLNIYQYTNTSLGKPWQMFGGHRGQWNGVYQGAGIFRGTSAISSITVKLANGSATWSGGTVLIYGVK